MLQQAAQSFGCWQPELLRAIKLANQRASSLLFGVYFEMGLWVFGSTLGCLVSEAAKVSVFRDVRVPVRLDAPNAWEREREGC